MPAPTRALIVTRLSRTTDTTTSPARQLAACQKICEDRGYQVVGHCEDLDISASKFSPFQRPALAPWLDRPADYDVIVVFRVDRLVRRVADLAVLLDWSEQHHVSLVSATETHFDTSSTFGRVIAMIVAMIAEMESEATRERTKNAYQHNSRQGKYRGGHTPLGYQVVTNGGEQRLEPDEDAVPIIHHIIDKILDGKKPNQVVRELNDNGVSPPQGKPGSIWRTGNLQRALRSPALLGHLVEHPINDKGYRGPATSVLGPDGTAIQRAEPIVNLVTYQRLQATLDGMSGTRSPYKKSDSLLLQVIFCGACDRPMYPRQGRGRKYYACPSSSLGRSCGGKSVRIEDADDLITENLLNDYGTTERQKRIYDPGSDTAGKIAEIDSELVEIALRVVTPAFKSGPAREALDAKADILAAQRAKLEAEPYRPSGYVYEPTGETFGDHWQQLDTRGRNQFLRDAGIRLEWTHLKGQAVRSNIVYGDLDRIAKHVSH